MPRLIIRPVGKMGADSADCTGYLECYLAGEGTIIARNSGSVPMEGRLPKSGVFSQYGGTLDEYDVLESAGGYLPLNNVLESSGGNIVERSSSDVDLDFDDSDVSFREGYYPDGFMVRIDPNIEVYDERNYEVKAFRTLILPAGFYKNGLRISGLPEV